MICSHAINIVNPFEYRVARRVLMVEVIRGSVRGRPRLGWMDGVINKYINKYFLFGGLGQQRYDGGGDASMR